MVGWTISPATRSATVTGTKRSAPTLQHSPTATMVARRVNALVIVPTYNERENLPLLVRDILTHEGF